MTGTQLSGVDGHHLSDLFLSKIGDEYCEPQHLMANCKEVGMDCSSLHFYHCDLGPGNIIVDPASGSIGIIDWETAGFVPREWIRTKFHICSGMDLEYDDFDERVNWRRRVARRLAHMGYSEVVDKWSAWWNSD